MAWTELPGHLNIKEKCKLGFLQSAMAQNALVCVWHLAAKEYKDLAVHEELIDY